MTTTPDSPDLDSILRRVRKLLAIAEDGRRGVAESGYRAPRIAG